jgi:hypothetical protein
MRRGMIAATLAFVVAVGGAGTAQAPVALAAACQTQHNSVYVELSRSRWPESTDHISDAIAAGQPTLLHIDRTHADQHREESLAGYPPKPGLDRDEWVPAVSAEGGAGADVRYIDPADNRGAGSSMGNQLEPWCDGQPFRIRIVA